MPRAMADLHGSREATASRSDPEPLLERLVGRRDAWAHVGIAERISILGRCVEGVLRVSDDWVRRACAARGIDPESPLAGEEWLSGPMTTVRGLRLLAAALRDGGRPRPTSVRSRDGDQVVARVFPGGVLDRLLYCNMSAEVWIEPGRPATQGRIYREKEAGRFRAGRLGLVLGAGNVSSIAPLDVAYKLFVEDQVVVLKMNPVNAYLGPLLERAFASLIEPGFLGIVYGDASAGDRLCRDPRVDTIHLTGSGRTYDAIVWGSDPAESARRRAAGTKRVDKPFTAELGNVTPVLAVPGTWSPAELDFQARHVAAMVAHNASFNCSAGKVLVSAAGWPQRGEFLERVREALARTSPRRAYYPGAGERYRAFLEHYPQSIPVGPGGEDVVPWTLIPGVEPAGDEYALVNEAFCGILADVAVDAADAPSFLGRAVDFVNDAVLGTLCCAVLIDPRTSAAHRSDLERAIARLRYGSIGVNVWPGVAFGLGIPSWGAFPGNTAEAIGSGTGVVHNAFLFDHPERSVVRAPFRIRPKPVWFADHRTLRTLGRHLTRFEGRRSPWSLARVALAGLRG